MGVVTITLTRPAVAWPGVVAVIEVPLTTEIPVAAIPSKVTAVAPIKFVPVIVTTVPPPVGPVGGAMLPKAGGST